MPKDKLLIVDDEHEIADLISLYLENGGFQVFKFYTAVDALQCTQTENIDLAILDVMLPDMNGFQLCRQIRETHHFPIIMLTAKGKGMDKITGLSLGADDYMTKPFQPLELVARVKAQLRRYKRYNADPKQEEGVIVHSGQGPQLHTKRQAALPDAHRVFDLTDPVPEEGKHCQSR